MLEQNQEGTYGGIARTHDLPFPDGDCAMIQAPFRLPTNGFRAQEQSTRISPFGIAVSALLLWWILHNVAFGEALKQLANVSIAPFIGMIVLSTARYPLVTMQWQRILGPDCARVPFIPLWHATAIGFMANNLLPARAGEFARAYAACQLSAVGLPKALASLAVEHVLSGIALLVMLAAGISASGFADRVVVANLTLATLGGVVAFLVAASLLGAIIIVRSSTNVRLSVRAIAARFPLSRYRDPVAAFALGIVDGLLVFSSLKRSTVVMLWSWLVWLVTAGATWCALLAFNIDAPWPAVFLLQALLGLVGAVGVIGAFEGVAKFVLSLYAVDPAQAVSCAVVWHVTTYLPITVLGVWSLATHQLHLGNVGRVCTMIARLLRMRMAQ